nr:MAG TPA: hypothetical protein [Caudoviricetes sp.]
MIWTLREIPRGVFTLWGMRPAAYKRSAGIVLRRKRVLMQRRPAADRDPAGRLPSYVCKIFHMG